MNCEIKTVDLFCGCGGMSLGFQNAGFRIVAAFDKWKPAIEVYRANFQHEVKELDLTDSGAIDIIRQFRPDMVLGGPPCQDFSSAGPNNLGSSRAGLLKSFTDIVETIRPRFFVIENVPRIRLKPIFSQNENRLRQMGYGFTIKVLNASRCGVPQQRQRIFWVGELGAKDGFLENYLVRRLSKEKLSLRSYFGSKLDTDYYFRVPTNYGRRGVFSVDEPSLTIRAVDRPIPKGYPGHPEDPVPIGPKVRTFTVLERGYIQTFPESFVFKGTKTNLNAMIGNAVPVKLAEFVGRALREYIEDRDAE